MGRQAMTGMDDVERQQIHGDPEIMEQKNKARGDCNTRWVWGIIVAAFLCTFVLAMLLHQESHYSVAIDSISGLDTTTGFSFNLTIGVASWSYGAKACIKPGTYLDVSYRGVMLAASEAETGELCVGPRKSAQQHVTARSTRIAGVPARRVLDGIKADMKQGAAMFDVVLHLPAGSYGRSASYDGKDYVSQCGGRQIGAATAWCDAPDQTPHLRAL
jgi:hypothetical protein